MPVAEERNFGSYVLEEHLASGGMAEVFRARRVGVAGFVRQVCIKRMLPSLSSEHEFVTMFIDEASTGAQLRHGNIVAIDDFGEVDNQFYLCMEFVAGVDLSRLLHALVRDGRLLPFEVATFVASEVLKALDYAHRKLGVDGRPLGVVHRDVSPHNVLVSFSGEVKLTDFGIAKAASRLHHTVGDVVKGKLTYMAPEQARGSQVDGRADLFALGVVFYEMITGRRPFTGANQSDLIVAVQRGARLPVLALRPDAPPAIVRVIDRLLALDPDERYEHGGDAVLDLGEVHGSASAARQLASIVAHYGPRNPIVPFAAFDIASLPRIPGIAQLETGPTLIAPIVDDETTRQARRAPAHGDHTEIALPPTAALSRAEFATEIGTAVSSSMAATRTIARELRDSKIPPIQRETSPDGPTRTIARPAVAVVRPHQRSSSQLLTAVALALMLASAAALAYALFAH